MHTPILPSLLYLAYLAHAQPSTSTTNTTHLTAPALVTINNRTVIQCWRLTAPFVTSSTPGTVGAKAVVVSNATNLGMLLSYHCVGRMRWGRRGERKLRREGMWTR